MMLDDSVISLGLSLFLCRMRNLLLEIFNGLSMLWGKGRRVEGGLALSRFGGITKPTGRYLLPPPPPPPSLPLLLLHFHVLLQ